MRKHLLLTSLLVLSACAGGTGGTSVPGPVVDVRTSNFTISSNIDNETRRSAHVIDALGEDYYNDMSGGTLPVSGVRGASVRDSGDNICKTTCITHGSGVC